MSDQIEPVPARALPNDVSRCEGRLDWGTRKSSFCADRKQCARYLDLQTRPDGDCSQIPVAMHMRVNGRCDSRIPA